MPDDLERGTPKRVCVIGGGIAGLAAAYELEKLGHDVTLLEADERCGGRILTWHFDKNNYGELGAMRVPSEHYCTIKYMDKFLLPQIPFVQSNLNAFYHLRGKLFRRGPWDPAIPKSLYRNLRQDKYLNNPEVVLDHWIDQQFLRLQDDEKWDMFNPAPKFATIQDFGQFSVWQHFRGIAPRSTSDFNDEEWEYIGRATGLLWDEKSSFLEFLVDVVRQHDPKVVTIAGGMEKLVDALQNSLIDKIQTNALVTDIALTSKKVRVRWSKWGQLQAKEFDYVICALPAGATVRIKFTPPLPARQYEALTNLSYQSAAKSLVYCKTRRWEWYDHIYGGGSYTDMENQECWYPSDNALEDPNSAVEMAAAIDSDGDSRPTEWVAKDVKVSHQPGVLIGAYMWGTNARRFASLPEHQRDNLVVTGLEELHPGIKEDILQIKHHSWDAQSIPGGGAWAAFAPGERGRCQEAMIAPHSSGKAAQSRVFFAGEHLGISHGWIQPAIQTAQGAVCHVNEARS